MAFSNGRTASPTASGCYSPCQTHSCENHKTVIRNAADIRAGGNAKLRKINKPMKSGTPITSSPNRAAVRCRATVLGKNWSSGPLSVFGQKRCAHTQRRHCLSWDTYSRIQSRDDSTTDGVPRVVSSGREGCEREPDAPDRGYGGPTRPSALISGPSDRWQPLK
jgi:hypothetical protein